MVLSGDEDVEQSFTNLCLDLNMDRNAKEEAWESYRRIRTHYVLEGEQLHWLACAAYVACRRSVVPTVGHGTVEGNCVSLTRLIRTARVSLIQFFNKMKKWLNMASLPHDFRDKIDHLERNFAVSTVTFKKYRPIFFDVFIDATDPPRHPRGRKQRKMPCSVNDLFAFCWTMFVQVKGHFPSISDDLVNSYHLLLCCIDWCYANALIAGRKDILNPNFKGLPDNFHSRDWKHPTEAPCIMNILCEKHNGLVVESKTIKEHHWKPHLKQLFKKKCLKGNENNLASVLDVGNFEANSKAINLAYEEYVLSVGDFDERIFLGDDAGEEIGTPSRVTSDFSDGIPMGRSLHQHLDETHSLAPSTPLTGRRYLREKDPNITPISTATQSVSRLQALLSGRKTSPSETLMDLFRECTRNPYDVIMERVKEMGNTFCTNFIQHPSDHPGVHIDFAKKRLQLAESLYFKTLESITLDEKKRAQAKEKKPDLTGVLEQDIFQRSLFACCLEIVIFSYNSQRTFPWIVDIFELTPYHFYRVIEMVIRAEEGLSRDVVKHLNLIEESILESHAWKNTSPLWDAIRDQESIPTCEEVSLPSQLEGASQSPSIHTGIRRLVDEGRFQNSIQSPSTSIAGRFCSPNPGNARRKLFCSGPPTPTSVATVSTESAAAGTSGGEAQMATATAGGAADMPAIAARTLVAGNNENTAPASGTHIITFQPAKTDDGRPVLISVQAQIVSSPQTANITVPNSTMLTLAQSQPINKLPTPQKPAKPKRTGSLALFFRKVYHLASVRLRDLCDKLGLNDDELRRKMWTCFEHTLVHQIHLMMDRHLDQIIMCSMYVMAKVSADPPQSFQNIMRCYRLQPQAQSHVYRNVLLSCRRRRTSGSSDSSKNGTSASSSPVTVEKEDPKEKDKRRTETLNIRSTSTLPVPHPNSQPPTPTKLIGMGPTFEMGEERGDLIQFYNQVYVKKMKKFALKFSSNQSADIPPLSPLPVVRSHTSSPRRVSSKHPVYISPHRCGSVMTPNKMMKYCFRRSPAEDLLAINNMIKAEEKKAPGKRYLDIEEDDIGCSPAKRIVLMKRLQDVNKDRQKEQNGTA